jgi:hypothetical protein
VAHVNVDTFVGPEVMPMCLFQALCFSYHISHTIEISSIVARTPNGSCAWLCMNRDVHGVLFVQGLAHSLGPASKILDLL